MLLRQIRRLLATTCALLLCSALPLEAATPAKESTTKAKKVNYDPVKVQQDLLRFADMYVLRISISLDKMALNGGSLSQKELLQLKSTIYAETCSIVSGPNPHANLLDLTVFVCVTRRVVDEYWKKEFGEEAEPLANSCRDSEDLMWSIATSVLEPRHIEELKNAIKLWNEKNPLPRRALPARVLGFSESKASEQEQSKDGKLIPGSVFNLLRIDPLSSLDPATREIAQTRLFAERALYVTQKMPLIMRWQIELLALNTMETPNVKQLVGNTTQISESAERISKVAQSLPAQLSAEREAILKALESQEAALRPLLQDIQGALGTGERMSTSLNTTLVTFDALMKRFGVGEPAAPKDPNEPPGEPFRIQDYETTARQLEATARELTSLLRTLDATLGSPNIEKLAGQVKPVVEDARTGAKEVVDYAFWKGVQLIGLGLAVLVAYRVLSRRLSQSKSTS